MKKSNNAKTLTLIFIIVFTLCAKSSFAVGKGAGLPGFVGSEKCGECHEEVFDMWKLTPHANMLVDAKKHPDRIIANYFPEGFPFSKEDIQYTLGSHWLQKYLTTLDDGQIYQLPNVWNIAEGQWEPYSIFDWKDKPYVIFCDGCHTVGFDYKTKTFFEEGIGCEACHGKGKKHAESEDPNDIVNPDKLTKERRDMICEQCHTDGNSTVADASELPFPVAFKPGDDITKYFSDFFMPKPKSKDWYWGTVDYKERHRMFMFWRSKFYSESRACDVCGFDRNIKKKSAKMSRGSGSGYMTRNQYCGTCHRTTFENYTKHSRHSQSSANCTDCHLPKLAPSNDRYSIHDHKFDFSRPEPDCIDCHYTVADSEDLRLSDPLFLHIQEKFFDKKYSKNAKFDKCNYCHYNLDEKHITDNGGSGTDCSKCHYSKKSSEYYKHSFRTLDISGAKDSNDLCKRCHEMTMSYHHKHHATPEIKVKLEGTVNESCKRCHKPFTDRW